MLTAAVTSLAGPRIVGAGLQLGAVDAGTLPAPLAGGIVWDFVGQRCLISDGGTWTHLATSAPPSAPEAPITAVAVLGDSISAGTWPNHARGCIDNSITITDYAVNGSRIQQVRSTYTPAKTQYETLVRDAGFSDVAILIGINDFLIGYTAGEAWSELEALLNEIRADGHRVWPMFVTPARAYAGVSDDYAVNDGGRDVWIPQFNAAIAAWALDAGRVSINTYSPLVDVDGVSLAATYDNGDHLHLNSTGHVILAGLFCDAAHDIDAGTSLTRNLLAFWSLNGNSTDELGGRNGTDTDVTYDAGLLGQAAVFNGATSRIEADSGYEATYPGFTIAAWVKTSASGSYYSVLDVGHDQSATDMEGMRIVNTPSGWANVYIGNNTNLTAGSGYQSIGFTSAVSTGAWVHLVGTYNGYSLVSYFNGVLNTTPVNTQNMLVFSAEGHTAFGANRYLGNWIQPFSGTIDEAGAWGRALTPAEVARLYGAGNGRAYPFDGGL